MRIRLAITDVVKVTDRSARSFSNLLKQSGIVTSCQNFRLGDQKESSTVTD